MYQEYPTENGDIVGVIVPPDATPEQVEKLVATATEDKKLLDSLRQRLMQRNVA